MAITPIVLALLADAHRLAPPAGGLLYGRSRSAGRHLFCRGSRSRLAPLFCLLTRLRPHLPLTDALYFSVERRAQAAGRQVSPYQFVRIWGTIGFIVPSLVLFFFLRRVDGTGAIMWVAPAFSLLAAANTFRLPRLRLDNAPGIGGGASLPTGDALRTLFAPGTRVFCLAMFSLSCRRSPTTTCSRSTCIGSREWARNTSAW